jgi:TRAP-type mannitol/chloroaromatic compound transport system permease small subunit
MGAFKRVYDFVGMLSDWAGRTVMLLVIVLIVSISYDVFMRYVFNAPTIWSYSFSYMVGTTIVAVGMPYVYFHNSNVRVDILYSRLPARARGLLDIVLTVVFFFPFAFVLTKVFAEDAWQAFVMQEVATESVWYPVLWPFKTVIAIAFALLCLQGIATFVKDLLRFRGGDEKLWSR